MNAMTWQEAARICLEYREANFEANNYLLERKLILDGSEEALHHLENIQAKRQKLEDLLATINQADGLQAIERISNLANL